MRILVISDSHGKTKNIHDTIIKEKPLDMIIHLGDKYSDFLEIEEAYNIPVHGVVGNVDCYNEGPSNKMIEIEGRRIFISHGHNYIVNHNLEMIKIAAEEMSADIVLFGHSHIPYIEDRGVYILNPGSISEPRSEVYPSYAILEISADCVNGIIICIK